MKRITTILTFAATASWLGQAGWAQTSLPLTPATPFVGGDADRSTYDIKPGEVAFHIPFGEPTEVTGSLSIQAPATIDGALSPTITGLFVFSKPTAFTVQHTISGADSVSIRVLGNGSDAGCNSFGPCTFTNLSYFMTSPPMVAIETELTIVRNNASEYYEITFYWTTTAASTGGGITMLQPAEISNHPSMPYNSGGKPLSLVVFGKGFASVTQAVLCGSSPVNVTQATDTLVSIPVSNVMADEGPCTLTLRDGSINDIATDSTLLYVSSIAPIIEIHQGVQIACDGPRPCIANHRTVARVRLYCNGGSCSDGKKGATGVLRVVKDGQPLVDLKPRGPADVSNSTADPQVRQKGQDALLFDVTTFDDKQNPVFPQDGSYDFHFVINARKPQLPPMLGPIPGNSENNLFRSLLTQPFKQTSKQIVIGVLVDPFRPGNRGPDPSGKVLSAFDYQRATYPMSQDTIVLDSLNEAYTYMTPEDDNFSALNDLMNQVNAWRKQHASTPQLLQKIFYFSANVTTAGYSNCKFDGHDYLSLPLISLWFCSSPTTLIRLDDPSIQAVIAHELGHHFGLGDTYAPDDPKNPDSNYSDNNFPNISGCVSLRNGCPVQDGFIDPLSWTVSVVPDQAFPDGALAKRDFMGNADRAVRWVDQRTWDFLYPKVNANANSQARPKDDGTSPQFVVVSGTLSPDGTARFSPFQLVSSADDVPATADGDYSIELQDTGGVVLQSASFPSSFVYGHSSDPRSTPFTVALPFPAQTSKVILKSGGNPLATRVVPQHSPSVRLLTPSGGETIDGTFTISWTGSHPDGAPLTYSVFYSADNGATWKPLAHNLTDTTFTWDSTTTPGSANALIGVTANDGVHNSDDITQSPLTVAVKGPTAFISAPDDGTTVSMGQPVTLQGSGFDLQDGQLPNSALSFSSDKDGNLGNGSPLVVPALSVATHRITLTVQNSAGKTATDSITITVTGAPAPVITSISPAQGAPGTVVTLTGSGFSATAAQNVVMFGNTPAQVSAAGATQLTTSVPSGLPAGAVPITVTVGGATSNTLSFTVLAPAPSISLSSTSLSFGNVPIGQAPGMQSLTVKNTGAVAATATAKTSAPFSVSPASLPLAIGQSGTFAVTFTPTIVGSATGALVVSVGSANDPPPVALSGSGFVPSTIENISRSLVYHEITRVTKPVRFRNGGQPVLSSTGNRVVYANAPGDETDARYNDIFVINPDGSGQRMVDSYKQNCDCGAVVDISADGNSVVSTDSIELRLATAGGSTGTRLITNREIPYVRISPKGDKVFFLHRRGEASTTDATTERGLYVINADGTGLKQIAGPKAVAALFGNTPDQVFPFSTDGWSLDVSADGSRVVFGVSTPAGQRILSVNADGSGLKQVMGPFNTVAHAALSGDGSKIAYEVIPPPCCSTPNEVGVVNFDGSSRKALATNISGPDGGVRVQLSNDGSKLLFGNNRLFSTDGSGFFALSVRGGYFSSDPAMLINDGLNVPLMNGTADRFIYSSTDDAGIQQLATMDINPAQLGEAPAISSPTLSQTSVALNNANQSTISAVVKTADKVTRVAAAVVNNGIGDPDVNAPVMVDDGTSGDVTAGDGIYTSNRLSSDCCATLGPRTVRVRAEVRDAGNRRHATAIEFVGLTVVSK